MQSFLFHFCPGVWVYYVYNQSDKGFENVSYVICMIIAPIFTSIYWWENYVYEGRKSSIGIPKLARHMRKCRTKLTLYASVLKMILTIVTPIAIYGIKCGSNCIDTLYFKDAFASLQSDSVGHIELNSKEDFGQCDNHLPLIVAAIGVLCSGICFKVGKVACKIMTQIVDYSLPLVLVTPATLCLIILWMFDGLDLGCEIPFPKWAKDQSSSKYFDNFTKMSDVWISIIAGVVGFVSLLLITNHVWTPGKERLQRTDKWVCFTVFKLYFFYKFIYIIKIYAIWILRESTHAEFCRRFMNSRQMAFFEIKLTATFFFYKFQSRNALYLLSNIPIRHEFYVLPTLNRLQVICPAIVLRYISWPVYAPQQKKDWKSQKLRCHCKTLISDVNVVFLYAG